MRRARRRVAWSTDIIILNTTVRPSRIILAFQQTRTLQAIYARHADQIRAAGLGEDWTGFRGVSRLVHLLVPAAAEIRG